MTVPHYGKRRPGGLTAASPGDTLFFAFGSYNDSGDSEGVLGTFAVTDIEVFKNGDPVTRATDSGYSLISDTGQVGDRVGLNRFKIQIFNTADDTGHYEVGAWYQVAIDAVTVDAKTVRFWAGSFEIDNVPADTGAVNNAVWNAVQSAHTTDGSFGVAFADMDTGIRDRLDELDTGMRSWVASDTGLRAILALQDTGKIATAVWAGDTGLRDLISEVDTGLRDTLADYDTGIRAILFAADTGKIATAVWAGDTGLRDHIDNLDTGLRANIAAGSTDTGLVSNAVWNSAPSAHTTDSTFGTLITDIDTGIRTAIAGIAAGSTDTGLVSNAVWNSAPSAHTTDSTYGVLMSDIDTGIRDRLDELDTGVRSWVASDTGLRAILALADTGKIATAVWAGDTGLRDHIDNSDTGVKDVIADLDTGLRDLITDHKNELDTGIKSRINLLAEDTGGVNINAIFGDTGAAQRLSAAWVSGYIQDTGLQDRLSKADTGKIATAVWAGDTGLRDKLDEIDTGLRDTLADYDTGIRFILAATDTGKIATAVWAGDTGLRDHIDNADTGLRSWVASDTGLRAQLNWLDTGLRDYIDNTDTGLRARINTLAEDTGGVNINAIAGDTGAAVHLAQAFAAQSTNSDTGLIANAAAIRNKTDSLTFTKAGEVDSNIQSVNDVTVNGTGAPTDEWGP